jgi:hypothetical protein
VTTAAEAELLHASDEDHLKYAIVQSRVIITQDPDFLRMAASGSEHRGVAFYASQSRSIGQVVRGVHLIWEVYEPEEVSNHIEYL